VQRHNLPHQVITADLTQRLVSDCLASDAMTFTYPCTKYSTIADIHQTRTGDELYLHALRFMAISRPEVFVIENVPGMRKFPIVMEAMTKMPDYYVTAFCPIKSDKWLPQRRDRLIIFGSRKPFTWQEPTPPKRITLKSILEKDPDVTLPAAIEARMTGQYRDLPIISDPEAGDIAPTAVAHYAKDKSTRLLADKRFPMGVRPYSVREWARLQGIPDDFTFNCSDTEAYRMIGNGVSVPVGKWIGEELKRYFNN
jgi:DNA (cytosine-5)-methyltransferase 1